MLLKDFIQRKAKELNIEIIESIEEEDILMEPIRIPKNLMALSDKLPKSNYNEKNRKSSERKFLSDSKSKPNKSNDSSEILKDSNDGELRLNIKQAKNRNASCNSDYINSLLNPLKNCNEDKIPYNSSNESSKNIIRNEEKKESKVNIDYIKYIQEKINQRKEDKVKNVILYKKPSHSNIREEKALQRREEIYRLYLRDLLNGKYNSPYLINSDRKIKNSRNKNHNKILKHKESLPLLPSKATKNNEAIIENQKYNMNEILHKRLVILGVSPDSSRRKQIIIKKPYKYF